MIDDVEMTRDVNVDVADVNSDADTLNTGERREELVGIAFNRLMKMSLPGGDHLSTWRYNTVKVCHPSDHPPQSASLIA